MDSYEYRHRVSLEDTNLVGNVYFANHVRWQGRCREMFLRDHAPEVLEDLRRGLLLVTTRVSCAYYRELNAFDEVSVRMTAGPITPNRLTMRFDYLCVGEDGTEELVARGEQEVACLRREAGGATAAPLPPSLRAALRKFMDPDTAIA
jgi:enediyne biosynthesis thioesterase